jgi:hypothetical protein
MISAREADTARQPDAVPMNCIDMTWLALENS